jgi:hypothetical protein
MEEFDFDLNNEIGTSVSQLKSKGNNLNEYTENVNTDDFDYDKVLEHFNSEQNNSTFNYDTNRDNILNVMTNTIVTDKQPPEMFTNTSQNIENRPKKHQNMNRFVRDLENNLDNFGKVNLNEPLPVNFTKPMIPKKIINIQPQKNIEPMVNTESIKKEPIKELTLIDNIKSFFDKVEFKEIIICLLLFMLLNNKVIIEFIYNNIPYIQNIDNPYPNLILRTLLFGIILILSKILILKK